MRLEAFDQVSGDYCQDGREGVVYVIVIGFRRHSARIRGGLHGAICGGGLVESYCELRDRLAISVPVLYFERSNTYHN